MKIIDARSGRVVTIGDTVEWGDGEGFTLLDADVGLFSGEACMRQTLRDYSMRVDIGKAPLLTRTAWVPLAVQWLHPRYFLQHVAFIPS